MQVRNVMEGAEPYAAVTLRVADMAQILIICESDPDAEQLKAVFREAGLTSEVAKSIAAGCGLAKSGQFRVVFCTPLLSDGSWRRLVDAAHHYALSFEVIVLARTFDLNEWSEALQVGAFDVLDVLCDLPKAAEAAKRALGTAYLKHLQVRLEQA